MVFHFVRSFIQFTYILIVVIQNNWTGLSINSYQDFIRLGNKCTSFDMSVMLLVNAFGLLFRFISRAP